MATIGATLPYRRAKLGREGRFGTGSLVFDLHRPVNRDERADAAEPPHRIIPQRQD